MIRMVFDNIVVNVGALGAAFGASLDVDVGHTLSSLASPSLLGGIMPPPVGPRKNRG
jgi:hypothetical protein